MLDSSDASIIKPEILREHISKKLPLSDEPNDTQIKPQNNINSRDLRENVFKKFEKHGYLHNYQGKKQYKIQMKKLGDAVNDELEDYGGKRSVYEIDKEIEEIKKIFKNPKCAEYLFSKLKNNEFFKKYIIYIMKSMFSLAKKDESAYLQSYRFGAEMLKKEWTQKEYEEAQLISSYIQNNTDIQIDEIADRIIDEMEKEKEQVCIMVLLCGLFKF